MQERAFKVDSLASSNHVFLTCPYSAYRPSAYCKNRSIYEEYITTPAWKLGLEMYGVSSEVCKTYHRRDGQTKHIDVREEVLCALMSSVMWTILAHTTNLAHAPRLAN